jgi:hypothetical protein
MCIRDTIFTNNVLIEATPSVSEAAVTVTNPLDLFGDEAARMASISVVSKDGSTNTIYKLQLTVSNIIFQTGFIDDETDIPETGWETKYSMISENIPGPGDHGLYDGPAAYKFVRGQSDKQGYMKTTYYESMDSLSFWMLVDVPDNTANLQIASKTAANQTVSVGTISGDQLSATEWNFFSFKIDQEESAQLIFTPTMPTDGDTRLWIDDLTITAVLPDAIVIDTTTTDTATTINSCMQSSFVLYPNPASTNVTISNFTGVINQLSICNLAGQLVMMKRNVESHKSIDVKGLSKGVYLFQIETNEGVFTSKFIKN